MGPTRSLENAMARLGTSEEPGRDRHAYAGEHITGLLLDSIVHPSDFSQASEVAFAHALKLTCLTEAELSILHVASEVTDRHWMDFPRVRITLARWGILPEGCPREAVGKAGLRVQKIQAPGTDPVRTMLHYLADYPADLLVLATHQRTGLARWFHKAVAVPITRRAKTMTLFVPHGVAGFISLDDGAVTLKRILIPIDTVSHPQAAVDVAAGLAQVLGCHEVAFTLMYVGAMGDMPAVHEPRHTGWSWDRVVRHGSVAEQILEVETACAADLVVLTTRRQYGVLDALRVSILAGVLRRAQCPVLALPVG